MPSAGAINDHNASKYKGFTVGYSLSTSTFCGPVWGNAHREKMRLRMPLEAHIRVTEWLNELLGRMPSPTVAYVRWAGWGSQGHTPHARILCMAAATDQVRGRVTHLLISWGDAAGLVRLTYTYLKLLKRLLILN